MVTSCATAGADRSLVSCGTITTEGCLDTVRRRSGWEQAEKAKKGGFSLLKCAKSTNYVCEILGNADSCCLVVSVARDQASCPAPLFRQLCHSWLPLSARRFTPVMSYGHQAGTWKRISTCEQYTPAAQPSTATSQEEAH